MLGTNTGRDRIFVLDAGSGTIFGPFAPGTKIKYTQAPGATPGQKKIGSTTGQAGAVLWHITGTGDAFAFSTTAGARGRGRAVARGCCSKRETACRGRITAYTANDSRIGRTTRRRRCACRRGSSSATSGSFEVS